MRSPLGKQNIDSTVIYKINNLLSESDKEQLRQLAPYAPSWSHPILKTITI